MEKDTMKIAFGIVIAGALIAVGIVVGSVMSNHSIINNTNNNGVDKTVENNSGDDGLSIGNAPVLGDPNAPVTLVEFADFQCPYCALFYSKTEGKIIDAYIKTGKAKLVFKALHFLDRNSQYQESYKSALAGECAKEQGKFWEMHDAIFSAEYNEAKNGENSENNGNLNMNFFNKVAKESGMDVKKFDDCITSEKYKSQLDVYEKDSQFASPSGVSTPTIFVNGNKIVGARDFSVYKQAIDDALRKVK